MIISCEAVVKQTSSNKNIDILVRFVAYNYRDPDIFHLNQRASRESGSEIHENKQKEQTQRFTSVNTHSHTRTSPSDNAHFSRRTMTYKS